MKDGRIVFEGSYKEVITKENLRAIYGIDASLQMDESETYPICIDFELSI